MQIQQNYIVLTGLVLIECFLPVHCRDNVVAILLQPNLEALRKTLVIIDDKDPSVLATRFGRGETGSDKCSQVLRGLASAQPDESPFILTVLIRPHHQRRYRSTCTYLLKRFDKRERVQTGQIDIGNDQLRQSPAKLLVNAFTRITGDKRMPIEDEHIHIPLPYGFMSRCQQNLDHLESLRCGRHAFVPVRCVLVGTCEFENRMLVVWFANDL